MNITTSKLQILEYLQKITRGLRMNELGGFTTISISSALNISRSLTSQYLNELVKDERIIKISTRPVYYMDRSVLERKYQLELKSCEYLSLGELMKELHRNSPKLQDFQKAIGCDGRQPAIPDCTAENRPLLSAGRITCHSPWGNGMWKILSGTTHT